MLTETELSAIEVRANNATSGPWFIHYTDDEFASNARYISNEPSPNRHDNKRGLAEGHSDQVDSRSVIAITLLQAPALCRSPSHKENAEFIAHARTDVPRLIAEVKRLQQIVQKLESSKHVGPA